MSTFSWTVPTAPDTGAIAELGEVEKKLFGADIRFENDYFITAAGDYAVVTGLEALRAAIYRRLLTRPGEYKFVPEYGVGVLTYVKRRMTGAVISELKTAIRTNLLRDKRIHSIEDIAVEMTSDTLKLGIKIKALGEALYYLPFQFKTV